MAGHPAPSAPSAPHEPPAPHEHAPGPGSARLQPPPPPLVGRRSRVVALRVIGILIALTLLGLGAGSLVVQFFQQRTTEQATVTEPVSRLVADTDVGDLRIRAGLTGEPVEVTSVQHWSFRRPEVRVTVEQGVLTVRGDCSGRSWLAGWCSTDLEITLPPAVSLDLTNGVGDIRVTGITGAVAAESGTGDVTLAVPGSPSVRADTGMGDVTVSGGSPGGRLQASTGTGDVRLTLSSAPAEVRAETGTGSVDVRVPAGDSYRVDADAGTGEVRVQVPRDDTSARRIVADTGTGSITVRTG